MGYQAHPVPRGTHAGLYGSEGTQNSHGGRLSESPSSSSNIISYIIDQDPGSILYVHPTIGDARKFSRLRVAYGDPRQQNP